MFISVLVIDLAKTSFSSHGVDDSGKEALGFF